MINIKKSRAVLLTAVFTVCVVAMSASLMAQTPAEPTAAPVVADVVPASPDAAPAAAQDSAAINDGPSLEAVFEIKKALGGVDTPPSEISSVLFNAWQHALLAEAKQGFVARLPTSSELDQSGEPVEKVIEPGLRELSLGGIAYIKPDKWTVWLNGERVTPDAIPKEIIDIRVNRTHIELKWYDAYTNLIYPIRMRAHQRFNLDSRIFLPGTPPKTL